MKEIIPEIELERKDKGILNFKTASNVPISSLIEMIEKNKTEMKILNWGISQKNLEDVFFNVIKMSQQKNW